MSLKSEFGSTIHGMVIDTNETRINTVGEFAPFWQEPLKSNSSPCTTASSATALSPQCLRALRIACFAEADKGALMRYLARITAHSRAQLKRLL